MLLRGILISVATMLGMSGCQSNPEENAQNAIKELFRKYKETPVKDSIVPIVKALAHKEILLATEGIHKGGQMLNIAVSQDKQGNTWAYFYTEESELSAAFPQGSPYVALPFGDAFKIISKNETFGGIMINGSSKDFYLIPRELFDVVQTEISIVGTTQ